MVGVSASVDSLCPTSSTGKETNVVVRELKVEHANVAELEPYPDNPRTHSKKQIQQIAKSIERFGFTNPAFVSDDNQILAGRGRVWAAVSQGSATRSYRRDATTALMRRSCGLRYRRSSARRPSAKIPTTSGAAASKKPRQRSEGRRSKPFTKAIIHAARLPGRLASVVEATPRFLRVRRRRPTRRKGCCAWLPISAGAPLTLWPKGPTAAAPVPPQI